MIRFYKTMGQQVKKKLKQYEATKKPPANHQKGNNKPVVLKLHWILTKLPQLSPFT